MANLLSTTVSGNLNVTGASYLGIIYDYDDNGYYLNPNGTSVLSTINVTNTYVGNAIYFNGGNNYLNWNGRINSNVGIQSESDMRAPIFYDSNDTNYYLDPNGTSILSSSLFNAGIADSNNSRIYMPGGASTVNSGGASGAIKISLPTATFGANTMMSMTVHVYEYSTGQSFTIRLGGYNYYTHDWYNVFAFMLNDSGKGSNVPVYFGHDGSRDVIWLGEPNWGWSYPNVFVTDFQAGHTQYNAWKTGWNISFDSGSRTNVSHSRTAYRQIDTGNIGSQSVNYASSAGSVAWTNVSSRPTALSQFTNDLGNYGGFLTTETIGTGNTFGVVGAKYQINDTWLRVNSDNRQYQVYGNSRTILWRTDGATNDHGGGAYAYIWYYGGSADGNRRMISDTNGDLWTNTYGWLHDYFQRSSTAINTSNIGSQSVAYATNAGNADTIDNWAFRNTGSNDTINADTINSNGITYYGAGVSNFSGNASDGALYSQRYSDSWQHQIAGDYRSGMIAVRGRNNGTWTSWKTIIDSSTIGSQSVAYATSAGNSATTSQTTFSSLTVNNGSSFLGQSSWFGGYGSGSGPGLSLENQSSFARFAFWGLDFYDWNNGIQMTLDNGYVSVNNYLQAGNSLRAPIFYDSEDTNYYLDLNSTSTAMRARGGTLYGPNPTWGAYLYVGTDGRVGTSATVAVTNGNLHIDSQDGYALYLNWYSTTNIYTRGNLGVGSDSAAHRLHVHGTGYATSDFRAPIFYDSNDTAYYLDPNSSGTSLRIAGGIAQNNLVGRPFAVWGASGGATGAVVIKFPGDANNYGMIHAVIDIYEYSGNDVCTVIIGGHNWNSAWYSYGAQVIGSTNKQVRVAFKDGKYCIVIGDGSSYWSYGQVVLRKIQNGAYYDGVMDVARGYTAAIESDSYSWVSGDLRNLETPSNFSAGGTIYASGGNSSNWNTAFGWGNHAGLYQPLENQRLSTTNQVRFSNTYTSAWFRNDNPNTGLYNESTTMHWSSNENGFWDVSSTNNESSIRFYTGGHKSALRGYVYSNNSNQIGFLNNGGGWNFRTNSDKTAYVHGQTLTINADNAAWSSIYMNDGDQGMRELHCNSDRIGFLTQPGSWGSWCEDNGAWSSVSSMYSPIYYDYNDSSYYLDANASGTSLRIGGLIETTRGSGTMISHASMSDAFGYNGNYGTYIGSPVGGTYYLYANGTISDNGTIKTLINSGGGQTIGGITYFSNGESLQLYGVRGRFNNEYIHLYNKVGIGHPSGWGQGETSTPSQGLSTYGGINIAYGTGASSYFNGYLRIDKNWNGGDYGAEQFTIRGTYPSITLRSTTHDNKWLIHNDNSVSFYYGTGVDNNSWSRRFEIPTDGNIWMSWAGDYISNLLGAKQNASTAINTSNIGSQSVNYASSAGNADTVDGRHASQFWRKYETNIDLTGLSSSLYYPIVFGLSTTPVTRIRIKNALNSTVPSWSNHPAGFSLTLDYTSNGSGWGTTEILRTIHNYHERFSNVDICGGILQLNNSSQEVIYLRGGANYYFEADQDLSLSIKTSYYEIHGQSVEPRSTIITSVYGSATGNSSIENLYVGFIRDQDDLNYYLDPNGTSRLGTVNANELRSYGNTYLGDGNGDETHINDVLRLGATDSGDAHFYFGEGGSAGSDYGSHWYWDSAFTFNWYTRNAGTDTLLFNYVTNDTTYLNWYRHFNMQNREINYVNQLHLNNGFVISQGGSNYASINSWVFLQGYHGLYTSLNGAHFYPNNGDYGSWRIQGSRNGYNGIQFDANNGSVSLMVNTGSNLSGFHNNSYGWQIKYHNGTLYVGKNTYGGGTEAVVLDSSNWSSYVTVGNNATSGDYIINGTYQSTFNSSITSFSKTVNGISMDSFGVHNYESNYSGTFPRELQSYFDANAIQFVRAIRYNPILPPTNNIAELNNNAVRFYFNDSQNNVQSYFDVSGMSSVGTSSSYLTIYQGFKASTYDSSNKYVEYLSYSGNGDLYVTGVVYQNQFSDQKYKDDVQPIANALDKVNAIPGVEFTWNELGEEETGKSGQDVGVIAQEVQAVYPKAVREVVIEKEDYATESLVVDYEKLIPLALQAIRELSAEVTALKEEIRILKGE